MSSAALQHPPPKHRRPRLTLYRYVALEALRPTAFALLGLTVVVLTTKIIGFSELVINRGIPASTVVWMVLLEGVPLAARMVPFAMLVGALVALGRMGADREILALEASGVAAGRLVWPVVSFAGIMTIAALLLALVGTPWASFRLDSAYDLIVRVNEFPIRTCAEFHRALRQFGPGDDVDITFKRGASVRKITLKLEAEK